MNFNVFTPEQLAAILKSVRKQKKLSQQKAANRVGLLQKTVSALESNPEKCSIESFFKLLSSLELQLTIHPKEAPNDDSGSDW